MRAGRFIHVAVPFGLTLASLICILIAMLAGMLASMSNKNLDIFGANTANLDIFDVNTANLSISSSSLANLGNLARRAATSSDRSSGLTNEALTNATSSSSSSINITASDLELADLYKVSLWNYCGITGSNITCTNAKFDWALSSLDTSKIESTATSLIGVNVTLPLEVKSALKTFAKVAKWIEVVYIIATITTFVELVIGLFATCSRAGSYGTIIVSGLSTASIIVASIMVTAVPSTVVGAINSVGKAYGVKASLNTSYLAITWMAVAFSLASSFFWTFRICCSADHSIRKSSSGSPWRRNSDIADAEKMIPSSGYQRVYNPNETSYTGQQYDLYNPRTGMQTQQEYGVPIDGGGVGITEDVGRGGMRVLEDVGRGGVGITNDVGRTGVGITEDVGRGGMRVLENVGTGGMRVVEGVGSGGMRVLEDVGRGGVGITEGVARTGLGITNDVGKTGVGITQEVARTGLGITEEVARSGIGLTEEVVRALVKRLEGGTNSAGGR